MGLLDGFAKLIPGAASMPEDERRALAMQGLLSMGAGILANNHGNYGKAGPAIGAGISQGLLAMTQGANNLRDDKMRQAYLDAQLNPGEPAGLRELKGKLTAAGYKEGTPEWQQAIRKGMGLIEDPEKPKYDLRMDAEGNYVYLPQPMAGADGTFTPKPIYAGVRGAMPKPQGGAPAAPSGYRWAAGGNLEAIPGGPADASAKPEKPLPPTALRLIGAETDAIDAAGNMGVILNRVKSRISNGELQLGPVNNLLAKGQNALGMNTQSSRNYQSFVSDLNKLRNESLRLNKGVQTEGDAVRAWDELMANTNDPKFVLQRIAEIEQMNQRAILLHQSNVDMIRSNYGKDPMDFESRGQRPARNSAPRVDDLLSKYGVK